jgi:hypothetical protein
MWRVAVGVLALTTAIVGLWHPARVAVQTLLLLPALFPSSPIDLLSTFAPSPSTTSQTYTYTGGTVETELVVPGGTGRHPAVMLLLGAGDLPRSDLAVQFATALARLGVLVSLPESSGMLAEHLTFDEVDAIRVSLGAIDARTDVDTSRVGIVGLSASGALSIVAAGQSDMRDRIRFVNSFGSYDDAKVLLVDVASHSMVVDGDQRDWTPEQRTVEVVANALVDAGANEPDRAELVAGTSRERAQEIVNGFSPQVRQRLEAVSPSSVLTEVRAHLYLMHDVDDPFIPFTESRMLVKQAPPGLVTRYTEFSIFEHVIPDRPVPWQTFLPDLWRLFWHVHAVLLELL